MRKLDLLEKFNKFGESIAYATTYGQRVEMQKIADQILAEEKDRNTRAKVKANLKSGNSAQKLAKESGLHLDENFLKSLKYVLDYGYSEHFELQIYPFERQSDHTFFSALLKRDCLREDDSLLVKKYSRKAQGEFYLLGIICQCPQAEPTELTEESQPIELTEEESQPKHLRGAIGDMVSRLKSLEDTFIGRLENEIVLDPLAVYREV